MATTCGGTDESSVQIDVYNDLFVGKETATASVRELLPAGETLFTAPAPSTISGIGRPDLRYSIKNIGTGRKNIPFFVNAVSGIVTTTEQLDFNEQQTWILFIDAVAVGSAELRKCLRGGITLTVTVIPAVSCGRGQKITGSGVNLGCADCDSGTYQDAASHRISTCKSQPSCGAGTYFSAPSLEKIRTCPACPTHTYRGDVKHFSTACVQQPVCGQGNRYVAGDAKTSGSCRQCSSDTYMNDESHRRTSCSAQPVCSKGQRMSAHTLTEKRACSICPSAQYQDLAAHRSTDCIEQTTCGQGFKISADSNTEAQSCTSCDVNTYQDASSHRSTSCKTQATCSKGQFASADSSRAKRTCSDCPAGQYQEQQTHRSTSCTLQGTCGAGTRWAATLIAQRTCPACSAGSTFQDSTVHREAACKDAAPCKGHEFESSAPTTTTDRICSTTAQCDYEGVGGSIQYESKAPTATTNRECSAVGVCFAGEYMSTRWTKTVDLKCTACGSNTYLSAVAHREAKCTAQPTCSMGEFISADSKTVRRSCRVCPANRYLGESSHRKTSCAVQPTCNVGEKISADSVTTIRICSACEANKYQFLASHRLTSCIDQPTCGRGEYITADSKTLKRSCVRCGIDTYQDTEAGHRITACKDQTTCAKGEKISADSIETKRSCSTCGEHEYIDVSDHRITMCFRQPFCGPGTYISPDTKEAARFCSLCADNQYQSIEKFTVHRQTYCEDQPMCGAGEFMSPPSRIRVRTCHACQPGRFMEAARHRHIECDPLTPCGPGEKYRTVGFGSSTSTSQGTCVDCESGKYIALPAHFNAACNEQPACELGTFYTARIDAARTCTVCPANRYQDEDDHRKKVCKPYAVNDCPGDQFITNLQSVIADQRCEACPEGLHLPKEEGEYHTERYCIEITTATWTSATETAVTTSSTSITTTTVFSSTTRSTKTATVSTSVTTITATTEPPRCPQIDGKECGGVGVCQEYAVSIIGSGKVGQITFFCECPFPYFGRSCEKQTIINPCTTIGDGLCLNGGQCQPARGAMTQLGTAAHGRHLRPMNAGGLEWEAINWNTSKAEYVEDGADSDGWTDSTVTTTASLGTLHGPWGAVSGSAPKVVAKTFIVPSSGKICLFKFRSWRLRNWEDTEENQFRVDGQIIWSSFGPSICAATTTHASNSDFSAPLQDNLCFIDVELQHDCSGLSEVTAEFLSTIDEDFSDESWGFSNFRLTVTDARGAVPMTVISDLGSRWVQIAPENDVGEWDAVVCICPYSTDRNTCKYGPVCELEAKCGNETGIVLRTCDHLESYDELLRDLSSDVCSTKESDCVPSALNQYCMPGGVHVDNTPPATSANNKKGNRAWIGWFFLMISLLVLLVVLGLWWKKRESQEKAMIANLKQLAAGTSARGFGNSIYDTGRGVGIENVVYAGGQQQLAAGMSDRGLENGMYDTGRSVGIENAVYAGGQPGVVANPTYATSTNATISGIGNAAYGTAEDAMGISGHKAITNTVYDGGIETKYVIPMYDEASSTDVPLQGHPEIHSQLRPTHGQDKSHGNASQYVSIADVEEQQIVYAASASLYNQEVQGGGGPIYDQATDTAAAAWGLAAFGGDTVYDQAAASPTYDVAASGPQQVDLIAAWLRLAIMPAEETGLTRDVVTDMLLGSAGAAAGLYCLRPSSSGPSTIVLCVVIEPRAPERGQLGSTASIRLVHSGGSGSVVLVHDLTPEPVEFASIDDVLAHFENGSTQPVLPVPLTECLVAPSALVHSAAAISAIRADGVYGVTEQKVTVDLNAAGDLGVMFGNAPGPGMPVPIISVDPTGPANGLLLPQHHVFAINGVNVQGMSAADAMSSVGLTGAATLTVAATNTPALAPAPARVSIYGRPEEAYGSLNAVERIARHNPGACGQGTYSTLDRARSVPANTIYAIPLAPEVADMSTSIRFDQSATAVYETGATPRPGFTPGEPVIRAQSVDGGYIEAGSSSKTRSDQPPSIAYERPIMQYESRPEPLPALPPKRSSGISAKESHPNDTDA